MKPSFAIVGCGKVGTSLGKFLVKAGYVPAGCASKSIESAKKTAQVIGTEQFGVVTWEIAKNADIVFITTPDGVIEDTCNNISTNNGFRKDAVVLHCSGALPSTILLSAKNNGALIGSMHPLQSFAAESYDANPFANIIISVEGDREAIDKAKEMTDDLGAVCIEIATNAKTLYHASAVVASNYLVTLFDLAFKLIGKAGISDKDAFKVLKPLIDGTLSNIQNVGIPEALTGPIARGDTETVERHIKEIASQAPELLSLYKSLGSHTIGIAKAKGTLSESSEQALKQLMTL